ncbi:Septin-domain-containing protein [Pisolithus microcarpus]|nr:Septin-domain-containing protein [Pisolithus microcarpus]
MATCDECHIQDMCIHCCLYFITPTGHSLCAIDIIVMKKLSEVVNVIISSHCEGDSFEVDTQGDGEAFKQNLQTCAKLVYHNIWLYPIDVDETDKEEIQPNKAIVVGVCNFSQCGYFSDEHCRT